MKKGFIYTVSRMFIAILLVAILLPLPALAGPGLPFGGQIIMTIPCPCSLNFLIINWPKGMTSSPLLIYQPGVSVLYPYWNFFTPGTHIMGNYGPPMVCMIPDDDGCDPLMIAPLILMMGTSRY